MEKVFIMRLQEVVVDGQTSEEAIVHSHPFSTLPLLKSHLHPKFVIFDAGRKIAKMLEQRSGSLERYSGVDKIYRLYRAWLQPVPITAQKDTSYQDPNDVLTVLTTDDEEDGSYSDGHSNQTRTGRGDGFRVRPRTRSVTAAKRAGDADADHRNRAKRNKGEIGDRLPGRDGNGGDDFDDGHDGCAEDRLRPSVKKASKRKVLSESSNHNQPLLSEATLSRFNQQIGDAAWTGDRIHQWSKRSKRLKTKKKKYKASSSNIL